MKKSFLIYQEWEETFNNLTAAQSGKILMAMFAHAKGEKVELSHSLSLVFIPIRQQMDRNLENYEKISDVRRASAYKRWKQPQENANGMQKMQLHAKAYEEVEDKEEDIYNKQISNKEKTITPVLKDSPVSLTPEFKNKLWAELEVASSREVSKYGK